MEHSQRHDLWIEMNHPFESKTCGEIYMHRERERTKQKVRIDCVKCTCGMKNNHRYQGSRHQELVHRSGQDSKMPWLLRKCTSTSSCTAYSPKGSLGSALPGWENHPLSPNPCGGVSFGITFRKCKNMVDPFYKCPAPKEKHTFSCGIANHKNCVC